VTVCRLLLLLGLLLSELELVVCRKALCPLSLHHTIHLVLLPTGLLIGMPALAVLLGGLLVLRLTGN
jgi:hypothetical protein